MDSNMVWDFVLHRPDTTTSALFFFSDFGTPDGYRHFRAFGLNTYKFANANHEAVYVRFHLLQWSEEDFPLTEVGRLTLNRNPTNYYSDVEQIAFNPAHMVPGIEASPDITLQSRIFVYGDTQRYRLGVNYLQLPVNCPFAGGNVNTYMKEGPAVFYSQGSAPNYYPNSFNGPEVDPSAAISPFHLSGDVKR
ncbi:Catalase [Blattella germanica]|nr:Catalase [Blattella germanica]